MKKVYRLTNQIKKNKMNHYLIVFIDYQSTRLNLVGIH